MLKKMKPLVLVVEDDFLVAIALAATLENAGCTVLGPASSVEKAQAILTQAEPAAAFLDENLNGASVAPVVHELTRREIPFVILSGYAKSISDDALLHKAHRIAKPATQLQIEDALEKMLSATPG